MNIKQVRGQIRQIVKDILPEILTAEVKSKLYSELRELILLQLKSIETDVKNSMAEINQRSIDAQDYLVRHVSQPIKMPEVSSSTLEEAQIK